LKGHTASVTDIKLTSSSQYLISRASNGEVIVWDYKSRSEIYTYIQINRHDWLVKNPNGYFDGSPNALSLVNYVSGLYVISINSVFDKYYSPNLIKRLMSGENFNDTGSSLKTIIKNKPEIKFQFASTDKRSTVHEQDSVYQSKTKIYNNGKLLENESWQKEITFRGSGNIIKTFDIPLVNGENKLKVIAVNYNQIESDPIILKVNYNSSASNSNLHILSIGINEYKNSKYNLKYAVKDANDFSKVILKGSDSLLDNVHHYSLRNSSANKTDISKLFNELTTKLTQKMFLCFIMQDMV
jgi:hypothetical protein